MTQLGDVPTTDDLAQTPHIFPTGCVLQWPGSSAEVPTGWMLCDGRTLDGTNAAYLPLYDAIGVLYGGTGQNSFKIPGLVASAANSSPSRIPVGKYPGGPAAVDTCGKSGGSVDHSHGAGSLIISGGHSHGPGSLTASHAHGDSLAAPSHIHRIRAEQQHTNGGSAAACLAGGDASWGHTANTWDSVPAGYDTFATQPGKSGGISSNGVVLTGATATDTATGTGAADRSITGTTGTANPPFIAVNYIIKL